jgi:3'-phosphoadenosine 5'-phosphosulfate sulfotransferase (PAPS reductase)/FAD synthetase
MNLQSFDLIVLNSSGGKDSQAMTHKVMALAWEAGVESRVIMAHADLGKMEWSGAKELAQEHAEIYGIPFHAVHRTQNSLLGHIESRGMFPDNRNRFCTSDHKRGPVQKLIRHESDRRFGGRTCRPRILNCMGMRAQESPARSKLTPFALDARQTNSKREVWLWLPIHDWTNQQVWECIRMSGVPHHFAYDLGMPRLSCCFCIFSPRKALLTAGYHNRELLAEYVRVERKIGHTLRQDTSLSSIQDELESGWTPDGQVADWTM